MRKVTACLRMIASFGMGLARKLRTPPPEYWTLWGIALISLSACAPRAQDATGPSSHIVHFVTVEKDVKLETLDWGGTGRPLVFLAGLGDSAHVFDNFAPKFTGHYHVYGITRRGFGASSKPALIVANYTADRLGDDVLAVIAALKLNRPVLVGHSIAGEELSSISSRHPEKVAGLIYLDAALPFAYYNHANKYWLLDMLDLKKRMDALQSGAAFDHQFVDGMLQSASQLEDDLEEEKKRTAAMPDAQLSLGPPQGLPIIFGEEKYTEIHDPVLAIFACPPSFDFIRNNPALKAQMIADVSSRCLAQAKALQGGVPSAHIVRLPGADHNVFRSNEADVFREMNAFLARLP
jgi:pimeloyl-ACP methyl ester carboxylesterase